MQYSSLNDIQNFLSNQGWYIQDSGVSSYQNSVTRINYEYNLYIRGNEKIHVFKLASKQNTVLYQFDRYCYEDAFWIFGKKAPIIKEANSKTTFIEGGTVLDFIIDRPSSFNNYFIGVYNSSFFKVISQELINQKIKGISTRVNRNYSNNAYDAPPPPISKKIDTYSNIPPPPVTKSFEQGKNSSNIINYERKQTERKQTERKTIDPQKIYDSVDQEATYPGGMNALRRFIMDNFDSSVMEGGSGKLKTVIRFVVEIDGSVSEAKFIEASGNNDYDQECMRVVKKLKRWTPGKVNGESVRSVYSVPFSMNFE